MKKEQNVSVFDLPVPEKIYMVARSVVPVNAENREPCLHFIASFGSMEVAKDFILRLEFPARIIVYQSV